MFDFLEPLRAGTRTGSAHRVGADWVVLLERSEDAARRMLTRQIATFRRVGALYRRSDETHHVTLYPGSEVAAALRAVGFSVRVHRRYGEFPLAPGHVAIVARRLPVHQ